MTKSNHPAETGGSGRIAIGVVRSTHGLDGRVNVESYSGETAHFERLCRVILSVAGKEIETSIQSLVVTAKSTVIVKFDCADTVEQAEQFRGADIWVDRELAAPTASDEYYLADLCQCTVFLEGSAIGTVNSVVAVGDQSLLELRLTDGRLVMVPFLDVFVREPDIADRRIDLKVGWILE